MSARSPVVFLYTDIEGSTRRWESEPIAMREAITLHDEILRSSLEANGGFIFRTVGDAFNAQFETADAAMGSALQIQTRLSNACWPVQEPIRVRLAIHAGSPEAHDPQCFDPVLNRLSRILAVAHGGQSLVSNTARNLCTRPTDYLWSDLGEHRLRDLREAEHLFQLEIPGVVARFPPLRSLNEYRHNLKSFVQPLIGRDERIADLDRLKFSERLFTLVGPGGVGKSRLSQQVAANWLPQFPGGAWFVELAPVENDRVVFAIASTLQVHEEPERLWEALVDRLNESPTLLVMDNAEHVLDSVTAIVRDLLERCPHLKLIVTSREPLKLRSEQLIRLDPLAWQSKESLMPPAVQLFIDGANRAGAKLNWRDEEISLATSICRKLDGLPLALELCTSRLRVMSLSELADRLDQSFDVLSKNTVDAAAHQQTLTDTIRWSVESLSNDARELLHRLALFPAGASLDLVEAVVSQNVLGALTELVDKSLVVRDVDSGRFSLLESIRAFALDDLTRSGSEQDAKAIYVRAIAELAERAEPELEHENQATWFRKLDQESSNIVRAIELGLEMRHQEDELRIVAALNRYWDGRSMLQSLHDLLERAVTTKRTGRLTLPLARATYVLGVAKVRLGRTEAALHVFQQVEAEYQQLDNLLGLANTLNALGVTASQLHRPEESVRYAEACIALAEELGDESLRSVALSNLGSELIGLKQLERAREALQTSLAIDRKLGDRMSAAGTLQHLGDLALGQEDAKTAQAHFEEARQIFEEVGHTRRAAIAMESLGDAATMREAWSEAAEHYSQALAIYQELKLELGLVRLVDLSASLRFRAGAFEKASMLFAANTHWRAAKDLPRDPNPERYSNRCRAELIETIGEEAYDQALQQTQGWSWEKTLLECQQPLHL